MPVYANTPESRIVGRTDSKNPSTTCRGITSSGRPCRRPITASEDPPPASQNSRLKPSKNRADDPTDESMYCWQHKDQAGGSASSTPSPRPIYTPIPEERTSLDTLAERLGLAPTESVRPEKPYSGSPQRPSNQTRPKPKKESLFCCCFRIPIDDIEPQPRPRPHSVQPTSASTPAGLGKKKTSGPKRNSGSSLIPANTAPDVASKLLAELTKPVSQQDEAGYIYIFWLTPQSAKGPAAPADTARSLLAPPSTPPGHGRRTSDVLAAFARMHLGGDDDDDEGTTTRGAPSTAKPKKKKTILLKIGRATNVQRRLNEWQRQCGYDLSLVRYYPYVPSGGGNSPGGEIASAEEVARKVPHSHKVERLVHIELAGRGMRVADREKCEACGREHREWFEVEASRAAVAEVDEVVRRWSDWDEGV